MGRRSRNTVGFLPMMTEKEVSKPSVQKRVRQQGQVPFIWEEKPGTPKKEWKPEMVTAPVPAPALAPVAAKTTHPPVKLVASVPFKWEEKPGTPLPYFSPLSWGGESPPPHFLQLSWGGESPLPLPPGKFSGSPWSSPIIIHGESYDMKYEEGNMNEQKNDGMFELDLEAEANGFDTDFLLANRLLSAITISRAVPLNEHSMKCDIPGSPDSETDSTTSSYATGSSSLIGSSSFLECFFPLRSPESGFLDKVGRSRNSRRSSVSSLTLPDSMMEEFDEKSCLSQISRRTPTLGELLLMSCRRNFRRSIHAREQNSPLEHVKKRMFGCFIAGTDDNGIEGLHRRQRRLRLQLM